MFQEIKARNLKVGNVLVSRFAGKVFESPAIVSITKSMEQHSGVYIPRTQRASQWVRIELADGQVRQILGNDSILIGA